MPGCKLLLLAFHSLDPSESSPFPPLLQKMTVLLLVYSVGSMNVCEELQRQPEAGEQDGLGSWVGWEKNLGNNDLNEGDSPN